MFRGPIRRTTTARAALTGALAAALTIAPTGCQLQPGDLLGGGDTGEFNTSSVGLFLNPDVSSPLLLAGRGPGGDEFFLFGARNAAGGIDPALVESVVVRTAAGAESVLAFDRGLPVLFEGADGSSVRISYQETSADRFTATVSATNGATGESQGFTVDLDLAALRGDVLAAAQQAAATIQSLTGIAIAVPEAPEAQTAKEQDRAVSAILLGLVVIPLVFLLHYTVYVTGEIIAASFRSAAQNVQVGVTQSLQPLFTLTSIVGGSGFRVSVIPLLNLFVGVPGRPVF